MSEYFDTTVIGALITGGAALFAEVLRSFFDRKTKNVESPKWSKVVLAVLVVAIAGLSAFAVMQIYMNKLPTSVEIAELKKSVETLQATLDEKQAEVDTLTDENQALSDTNESLEKENQELLNAASQKKSLTKLLHQGERNVEVAASPGKDVMGNVFSSESLLMWAEYSHYGKVDFRLNKKYSTLTNMQIAVSEKSATSEYTEYKGYVTINARDGDDYTVLYTSPELSIMSDPIDVPDIDVSGIDWLEVRYYNSGNEDITLRVIVTGGELLA